MAASDGVAAQVKYGPLAGKSIRRSQYLADALKALGQTSTNIQSPLELAARLGAQAILAHGQRKADSDALSAVAADRQARAAAVLAGLDPAADVKTPPIAPPAPETPELAQQPVAPKPEPITSAPLPPAQPQRQYSPSDRQLLAQMITGEAGGEGPDGMAAAGSVALNRLNKGGYGKTLSEVILAPNQFEAMRSPKAPTPEAQAIAEQLLGGSLQDPTGGAVNFLNPDLQASLGREQPSWAPPGQGQRIGGHVFYGGQPAAAPPQNLAQPGPIADQPFQVAAAGPLQPGMIPSSSPPPVSPGGGAPPAASPPLPGAAGGPRRVTADEVALAKRLLSDPMTYDQGYAYALELQKKEAEAQKWDTTSFNGIPGQVNPYSGETRVLGLPEQARNRTMTAQDAGMSAAPAGTYVNRSPTGEDKVIYQPPSGYQAGGPGGALQFQQGGPADPYRPQPPAAGYEYAGGRQQPIQGGPQDPRTPQNLLEGTKGIRAEIQPVVQQAIQLKRNVDSVRAGYSQKNGAGDIAMVNGLQRLIDEGVVREGDVSLQLKAQGLQGAISGLRGYMTSDGFFTDPAVRDKVMKVAETLYGSVNSNYRARVAGYQPIVDRAYGEGTFEQYVFPTDTARSLGWAAAPPGGGGPPPPKPEVVAPSNPQDAALALLVKRGTPLSPQMQKRARELGLIR